MTYIYRFEFQSDDAVEITINLNPSNLSLIKNPPEDCPRWTELDYYKCPNCILDAPRHRHCPVSLTLLGLIDKFGGCKSYEEAIISIITEERTYVKKAALQKGLSSLIGIYMVTCGCPVMEKLRPMVRYHLPFATESETKYRALSMYLLAQFFIKRHGGSPDWQMENLKKIYEDIRIVNRHISKRLSGVMSEDAGINAIIILDCFADSVSFSLSKERLEELEMLFEAYIAQ